MATKVKDTQTNSAKDKKSPAVVQDVEKDIKPLQAFFTKFGNDWVMNLSGMLAYNLLMAMFPIFIAIIAILGLFLGSLDPTAKDHLISQALSLLPQGSSKPILDIVVNQLAKASGILSVIAIVLALFNGSRLFINIEACFGIIYHVRQRQFLQQNLMAFGMLLLFIILIPIMAFVSTLPALVFSLLQNTPIGQIPGLAILFSILGGLIASWIFFQAIYMVVPNQKISFRNGLWGALAAAVALEVYLLLFPFYATHFLGGYAGQTGLFIIVLIFFYYFAVILLLGAEVNAFFAEKVKATPVDLVTMVHLTTSHLPKTQEQKEEQAAASHKELPAGSAEKAAVKAGLENTPSANGSHETPAQLASLTTAGTSKSQNRQVSSTPVSEKQEVKKVYVKPSPSRVAIVAEAVAGTGLAFLLELLRLRRRQPR